MLVVMINGSQSSSIDRKVSSPTIIQFSRGVEEKPARQCEFCARMSGFKLKTRTASCKKAPESPLEPEKLSASRRWRKTFSRCRNGSLGGRFESLRSILFQDDAGRRDRFSSGPEPCQHACRAFEKIYGDGRCSRPMMGRKFNPTRSISLGQTRKWITSL